MLVLYIHITAQATISSLSFKRSYMKIQNYREKGTESARRRRFSCNKIICDKIYNQKKLILSVYLFIKQFLNLR